MTRADLVQCWIRVDDLRFEPPQANSPYQGILNATYWGNQCINTLEVNTPSWITPAMEDYFTTLTHLANAPYDEDCMHSVVSSTQYLDQVSPIYLGLNLNVILPASVTEGAMLPVVAVSVKRVILPYFVPTYSVTVYFLWYVSYDTLLLFPSTVRLQAPSCLATVPSELCCLFSSQGCC